jgi:hypothetical protein
MKTLYKVSTILILALGLLHISLTPMFFPSLTSGALWFAGGGIMIVFLSFFNFILMGGASKQRVAKVLTHTANLTGLVFACGMLFIESRRTTPGPSTWVVLALLVFETIAAFRYAARRRAYLSSRTWL